MVGWAPAAMAVTFTFPTISHGPTTLNSSNGLLQLHQIYYSITKFMSRIYSSIQKYACSNGVALIVQNRTNLERLASPGAQTLIMVFRSLLHTESEHS